MLAGVAGVAVFLAVGLGIFYILTGHQHSNQSAPAPSTTLSPTSPNQVFAPPIPSSETSTPLASTTPVTTTLAAPPTDPAQVVMAYFAAINKHDYPTAWALGGKNLDPDFDNFVAGLQTTADENASAQDSDPTTAAVQLVATQTDGPPKAFAGTYTVVNGIIVSASMHQVN